jgi:hemoglobin
MDAMTSADRQDELARTPFEQIGGAPTIERLVAAFYPRVQAHPALAPLFPDDITVVAQKQALFLTQFLGGPPLYTQVHGHPMLRARHLPFPITSERADAWLSCMMAAMDEVGITGTIREFITERLTLTAHHMVNTSS